MNIQSCCVDGDINSKMIDRRTKDSLIVYTRTEVRLSDG